jgi:poly(3-hydroxyalkanoate) synthetase
MLLGVQVGDAPQIKKYDFMDPAPGRSFIENALGHGIPCFTISWRKPRLEQRDNATRTTGRSPRYVA